MQRAAAQVHRHRRPALAQREIQPQVRLFDIDRGPFQAVLAHRIDHRILDPLRSVARVGDDGTGNVRVHRQGMTGRQVIGPVQLGYAVVQRVFVRALEFGQRPQHAAGQARPQHRTLGIGERAFDMDAGNGGGSARGTQRQQFVGKQVFQARWRRKRRISRDGGIDWAGAGEAGRP